MPGEKTVVAVYGTVREGMANHETITAHKAAFIRKTKVKGYKIYDHNGDRTFPMAFEGTPEDELVVELYRLGPKGLAALDGLEGYKSTWPSSECRYIRKQVVTVDGDNVQIYVRNKPLTADDVLIPSGDWAGYMGRPAPADTEDEETHDEPEEDADNCEDLEEGSDNFDALADEIYGQIEHPILDVMDEDTQRGIIHAVMCRLCDNAKVKIVIDENGDIVSE